MRRYGQWSGNPKGHPEDVGCCVQEVRNKEGWIPHQCRHDRGHGPNGEYCKQHTNKLEQAHKRLLGLSAE